ncbi:alanine racemase [Zobellia alginiliquefaciens]|uniref:alanine racemase n=1 Tax=Zobellia alginiliquefaciens TaxID=3032586 RepID=UPI0023E4090E|nr:alanine racemase [Zobellia alginiliquefaciens]
MAKASETVLEIDLLALEHNYRFLKSRIKQTTKFLGVVKAFAYGSDSVAIARKLEVLGADYLAVAYVSEGVVLRQAGIKLPILVLHPLPVSFDNLVTYDLEPNIYSIKILKDFLQVAQERGLNQYPIHLKFNTGLNRLGFTENEVETLAEMLKGQNQVKVVSLFSHLAASEDLNEREFTENQIARFEGIVNALVKHLKHKPMLHLLNTSGIINYAAQSQYDMVRSGIGLYGFGNEAAIDAQLKPVATLKTVISQIHTIIKGQSIGYNMAYRAQEDIVTATLPVGHADGIGRQYGNGKAYVTINGQKAPIIGNVCMDMIMVNITGIDCKEGDEVIVFGKSPTAEAFASGAKTISYEILTGISQRVTRLVVDN